MVNEAHISLKELQDLVESLNGGVYRNTPGLDGRFLYSNASLRQMFGYDAEEMKILKVCKLYQNSRDREDFEADIHNSGGFIKNKALKLVHKNGNPVYGEVTAQAMYDSAGKVLYYNGIILDVTDLVEVYENISHQIITPLLGIRENANALAGESSKSKSRLLLSSISGLARIAVFLTKNLNFMSTILTYTPEGFRHLLVHQSISPIIHDIVIDLQEYARQEKSIRIEVDSSALDALPKCRLHRNSFVMVAFCVLDNAIKYSFENTTVKVYAKRFANNIIVYFENEGIPVLREEIGLIFERRYRGKTAQSFVPGGTGLGLYFSKKIMELHGGKMIIEPSKNYLTIVQLLFPIVSDMSEVKLRDE